MTSEMQKILRTMQIGNRFAPRTNDEIKAILGATSYEEGRTVGRIIGELVKRGYVKSVKHWCDSKVGISELTDKGKAWLRNNPARTRRLTAVPKEAAE